MSTWLDKGPGSSLVQVGHSISQSHQHRRCVLESGGGPLPLHRGGASSELGWEPRIEALESHFLCPGESSGPEGTA